MDPRTLVAVGVAAVLIGGAFAGPAARIFLAAAGLCFAGAAVLAVARRRRPGDPYSLSDLRRVQDRAEIDAALGSAPAEDADEVVCARCGELNAAARPLCRRCGAPLA